MRYATDMTGRYSPLYFLASLGAGGLAVSFFMYLLWLTPHEGSSIANFTSLTKAWASGDLLMRAIIATGVTGIAIFAALHVRLLVWNLGQRSRWMKTPAYENLRKTNAETQLLAVPLALAMSVNVGFVAGAVFVPGLWEAREYLFPLALLAFGAIGIWAMRIMLAFLGRVLAKGGFDCAKNNSLGQLLGVFAFAMVGVGFSAAAAMTHVPLVSAIGYAGTVFFITTAIVLGLIMLILGFRAMMEHAAAEETTPTLWIMIPILTVVGIALYRLKMAMAHNFGVPVTTGEIFAFFTTIVSMQLLFGLIGYAVMSRVNYFSRWVSGPERSPGSYALICPGVALMVSLSFLLNAGIVKLGLVTPMSTAHLALHLPIVALQVITLKVFFDLNRKLLADQPATVATAAAPAT